MEFFVRQHYNASQIVMTAMDRLLADGKPITGENMRAVIFRIRRFQGLIPLEFKTNTATVPIDINVMHDGKDVTIKSDDHAHWTMLAPQLLMHGPCSMGSGMISRRASTAILSGLNRRPPATDHPPPGSPAPMAAH